MGLLGLRLRYLGTLLQEEACRILPLAALVVVAATSHGSGPHPACQQGSISMYLCSLSTPSHQRDGLHRVEHIPTLFKF